MLPHDLSPGWTAFHYFRTWRRDGTWERVHAALRGRVRFAKGSDVSPSAAIIDSQSVKATEKGRLVALTLVRESVEGSGTSSTTRSPPDEQVAPVTLNSAYPGVSSTTPSNY